MLNLICFAAMVLTGRSALPMSSGEFNGRMALALENSKKFKVRYHNSVGEGDGMWDTLPRYPNQTVNCLTWLNDMMAETYGQTPEEKQRVMDRIRYFKGQVGFGLRKHFVDQWLKFDPEPLTSVDFSSCAKKKTRHVTLDPTGFAHRLGYECPLFGQDQTSFDIEYFSPRDIKKCAQTLAPGYYVFFLVPKSWYVRKYGKISGPMGLVHGEILEVGQNRLTVFNASLNSGHVENYPLDSVLQHGLNEFLGAALYRFDPHWNWTQNFGSNIQTLSLQACEKALVTKGRHLLPSSPEKWELISRKKIR